LTIDDGGSIGLAARVGGGDYFGGDCLGGEDFSTAGFFLAGMAFLLGKRLGGLESGGGLLCEAWRPPRPFPRAFTASLFYLVAGYCLFFILWAYYFCCYAARWFILFLPFGSSSPSTLPI